MSAYYNEIDPYAADWLRNLIAAGHIASGVVDERSIEDVRPGDIAGFTQCHFFAGIGVWSYALRLAGWPDDRSVWTGSCPCQPFSAAGQGTGFADERHLWPHFHWLIQERRPPVVFGEQVASKDAEPWLDLVQDDMEALGYAFGAVPFPAAGVGAPHIRDRLYWVGHAARGGWRQGGRDAPGGVAAGISARPGAELRDAGAARVLANGARDGWREERPNSGGLTARDPAQGRPAGPEPGGLPCDGYWRSPDWILCCDPDGAAWRPVEPGTFPLAHGAPARVGRLRAYGNAINAEQARAFIEAFTG